MCVREREREREGETVSKTLQQQTKFLFSRKIMVLLILHWIKAHMGNEGNERANALAKQGTSLTLPPTPLLNNPNFLPTPIPLSHVRNITKELSLNTWNLQWDNSTHYRQTKIFFPKVDQIKSGYLLRLNRDDFGRAIRWLTGHCFLNRHNHIQTLSVLLSIRNTTRDMK